VKERRRRRRPPSYIALSLSDQSESVVRGEGETYL
jgi:hypothetical protein